MKKGLKAELERMHRLSYGYSNKLNEGLKKKINLILESDPKKADIVTDDLSVFYKTLTDAANAGGISQQAKDYQYQKSVESLQIGLILLGYELPRFGVDGKFGPETADAVNKFRTDQKVLNEETDSIEDAVAETGAKIKGDELESGGPLSEKIDDVVANIIKDFKKNNPNVQITLTAGNDKFHQNLNYVSQHTMGNAIDLTLNPLNSKIKGAFENLLNQYKSKIPNFSYINEYDNPTKASTGGHFHIQIGGKLSQSNANAKKPITTASPTLINKLIELLKAKNIKSEDIKPYVNVYVPVTSLEGVATTDFDKIISAIVDNLEGGYYHPNMLSDGRVKDVRYENSGETMFGLDRLRGGELNEMPEGQQFWALIDKANASTKWPWNYKGGVLASQLKSLLSKLMQKQYLKYSGYLTEESRNIINKSTKLTFNFVYATFNGVKWFQRFARQINGLVAKGVTNPEELANKMIDSRLESGNSLIAQGGKKIKSIINTAIV